MTWLVIASEQDKAARWAAERLLAKGHSPLAVVTDFDLAGATWQHRAGDDSFHTVLNLADGRVIDSVDVQGTLNRLSHVPASLVAGLNQDDRAYALQELTALVLSWLAAMPGPILNPADPRGLCGAWRPPAEWALLAANAGLHSLPVSAGNISHNHQGSWKAWPPYGPVTEDVLIAGETVFANRDLSSDMVAACLRLSQVAATPLLGLALEGDCLAGATPLPDLRAGGDGLITAIADVWGAT